MFNVFLNKKRWRTRKTFKTRFYTQAKELSQLSGRGNTFLPEKYEYV